MRDSNFNKCRHAITDMKSRLERLESLLSSSRNVTSAENEATAALLPVASDDELSFYLTDRMGFSSFIGSFLPNNPSPGTWKLIANILYCA